MATFEETVLSLTPLLFWRCKDLTGTTITDYSGNNYHGTIVSGSIVLGQPSAVETDPDARSAYIPDGFASNIAELDNPLPVPLQFTGNFTVALFVRHQEEAGTKYLFSRGGVANSTGTGLHFKTNGIEARTVSAHFRTWDGVDTHLVEVDSGSVHLNDTDYFVAMRRNGAVVDVLINAVVTGTTTGADTNPLLFDTDDEIVFGAAGNNLAPLKGWASELMIFDYAVPDASLLAVYESALNVLSLSAVSNVIPSAVLYSDIEPDPISFPFRHNWSDSLIERLTFRTSHSKAVKGYESANQQRVKPRREIEFNQVLRDNDERNSFRSKLTVNQHNKWFIPILEDREQLTTTLSAGSTLMPATVQYRDYEVGSWVELRQLDSSERIIKHELALVTSLSPLTTTAIVNSYDPLISTIGPTRRAILDASQSLRGHTAEVEDLTITARLIAEDEKIVPNRVTPWTPTITYHDYEVFDPSVWQSNDWTETVEYETHRDREDVDFDVGPFTVESDTAAANEVSSYRMLLEGRDKHAAILGWFYARAGAWSYLWVPTMRRDLVLVDIALSSITVEKHNYFENFLGSEFRRDIAFVYNDNSMTLRRIDTATLDGANEVLELDGVTPTTTNLRSISYLRFCRLDGDALEIAHVTDTKAYFAWRFREMLSSPE